MDERFTKDKELYLTEQLKSKCSKKYMFKCPLFEFCLFVV